MSQLIEGGGGKLGGQNCYLLSQFCMPRLDFGNLKTMKPWNLNI